MLLEIQNLTYRVGDFALKVEHLSFNAGEKVLILGQSGAGKSTFLNLVTGIIQPDEGNISFQGKSIFGQKRRVQDRLRGETFGIIFQSLNLLPFATARDNVLAALAFAPERRKRAGNSDVANLFEKLGLPASALKQKASALSVGQQQRVSIARAFIGAPPLIIADEPTSALDDESRDRFLDLLLSSLDTEKQSILVVSHDTRIAPLFDRVIQISDYVE